MSDVRNPCPYCRKSLDDEPNAHGLCHVQAVIDTTGCDYVAMSRGRFERLMRVVMLARESDRLEKAASIVPVGISDDTKRMLAWSRAYGARIDMGEAIDALEEGDVKNTAQS